MRHALACIVISLLMNASAWGQEYEWVKFFQGQSQETAVSLAADANGNQYISFRFYYEIKFDTLTITGGNADRGLVLKQDSSGHVLWYKVLNSVGNYFAVPMGSSFNSQGNFLLVCAANADLVIGSDTIPYGGVPNSGIKVFIVEFDAAGNLVRGNVIIDGTISSIYNVAKRIFCDGQDNLYLSLVYTDPATVYDTSGSQSVGASGLQNIVFKFSGSGQKFEWVRVFPYSNFAINNIAADISGNVYVSATWSFSGSFSFGGSTISNPQNKTGAVFILDNGGNDKNWFYVLASGAHSSVTDVVAHDTNSVYVSGHFLGDSALFDNVWKKTPVYGGYHFFARYKANGDLIWAKHEDTSYTTFLNTANIYGSITNYEDEYVYLSYYTIYNYNKPIIYDGQAYLPNYYYNYGMNMKFDKLGNVLWGFRTQWPFIGMGTDAYSNLYFNGSWYTDTIKFGSYSALANAQDGFVGKTFDYAIFRGFVSGGPYCAGDTIDVPYTIHGVYGDTNYFVAELSDEFGNFTGNERELGRIQSRDSGTIHGILPLFQVASSNLYRIRIRSTVPQVQSFYKLDTLRLLIYSRDKADPGGPETMCRGDTFMLNTYGGTKWEWSPADSMSDSTLRQPLIWPDSTSTYRIVISDSSGCGEADTAFKTIVVRNDPEIEADFTDSMICNIQPVVMRVNLTEGDSSGYHVRWYRLGTGAPTLLRNSTHTGNFDTLSVTAVAGDTAGKVYMAVLNDSCSIHEDTAYVRIRTYLPLGISLPFADTILCHNASIAINPTLTGGRSQTYSVKWLNLTTNQDTTGLAFQSNVQVPAIMRATLSDNCMAPKDSATTDLMLFDSLQIELGTLSRALADTQLCPGENFVMMNRIAAGNNTGLNYKWFANDSLMSVDSTFKVIADSLYQTFGQANTTLSLYLKLQYADVCSTQVDSVLVRIPGKARINSGITDTTICLNAPFAFGVNLDGGDSSAYQIRYFKVSGSDTNLLATHDITGYSDSLILSIPQGDTGGTAYFAILDDGCNKVPDTAKIRVRSYLPLELLLPFQDTIVCSGSGLNIKPGGLNGNGHYSYSWKLLPNGPPFTGDSLILNGIDQTLRYQVMIDDHCQAVLDSGIFTINIFDSLSADIQSGGLDVMDTIFCLGRELVFNNGADTSLENSGKAYKWFINNNLIESDDTANLKATDLYSQFNPTGGGRLDLTLKLQFSDICIVVYDSALLRIPAPLELTVTGDSIVCPGKPVFLNAQPAGGLANDYLINWYWFDQGVWKNISNDPVRKADTFTFYTPIDPNDTFEIMAASLQDGCNTDTVLTPYHFSYFPPLRLSVFPDDTLACHQTLIEFQTNRTGGSGSNYEVYWLDTAGNSVDTGFQFTLTARHSGASQLPEKYTYKAVLIDGCMPHPDTATFTWNVNPQLEAAILNNGQVSGDTLLCYGESITFKAAGSGGDGSPYTYSWSLDSNQFSTDSGITIRTGQLYDSLIQTGKTAALLTLVIDDSCTGIKDSATIQLMIRDPLFTELVKLDTLCYGNDWRFETAFEGGDTSNYVFNWFLNGNPVSQDSLYDFQFGQFLNDNGKSGLQTLKVVFEDGCSVPTASDSFEFFIPDSLTIKITADRVCADPYLVLKGNASGGKQNQYSITWFDENNDTIGQGDTLSFTTDKPTTIRATLGDNCSQPEASDTFRVYPQPRITMTQSDTAGCEPLELSININKETQTNNHYKIKLNGHETDTFNVENYDRILSSGTYYIDLEISSEGGCTNNLPLKKVDVYPLPVADFTWDPAYPNWDNKSIRFVNQSTGADSFQWDISSFGIFTDFEPVILINDSGSFLVQLIAVTDNGCEDTTEKWLRISETFNLFIPNAFSPNSNNHNELFMPIGTGYENYDIIIYDRWGIEVFRGDKSTHWDGTYDGAPVPDGVYVYILQLTSIENIRYIKKGFIHVLR